MICQGLFLGRGMYTAFVCGISEDGAGGVKNEVCCLCFAGHLNDYTASLANLLIPHLGVMLQHLLAVFTPQARLLVATKGHRRIQNMVCVHLKNGHGKAETSSGVYGAGGLACLGSTLRINLSQVLRHTTT